MQWFFLFFVFRESMFHFNLFVKGLDLQNVFKVLYLYILRYIKVRHPPLSMELSRQEY